MIGISPAILAASLAATGVVAFAAGFVLGIPSSHAEARSRPIVDPNAWDIAAPARLWNAAPEAITPAAQPASVTSSN